ncbi:flagellar filament capping protein FliD [Ferrimonas lipolytica]|uniref:Flagellar hook-associated protein 2 n=1 Tax=Ferrimonas lipolytica TaxID=2724191 RepID=A0A6H1UCL2_9GAMM|nr:flagellar filament capping protein FliD [Ferrimonas lipolytica]QIZ76801.1 flagellar filament capping protein FliD [Ferrimonas lipolytica]
MSTMPASNSSLMAQQLVAAERMAQDEIYAEKEANLEAQADAYDTLESALKAMQSDLAALDGDAFDAKKGSLSNESVGTVDIDSAAPAGIYDIEVTQLAKQHKISSSFASAAEPLPTTGTVEIAVGTPPESMVIDFSVVNASGAATVTDLVDYINDAPDNPGVTAALIQTGDGEVELMLSGDDSGAQNNLTVTATGTGNDAQWSFPNELNPAQDAHFSIDGVPITSSSNQVEVIDGVTLDLKQVGSTTLTVEQDIEATQDAVEEFIDSFNTLMTTIDELTQTVTVDTDDSEDSEDDEDADEDDDSDEDEDTVEVGVDEVGVLKGDSSVRMLRSDLRELVFVPAPNGMTLSDIGVEMDRDGQLSLNEEKFEEALANDSGAVEEMFAGPGGIIESFDAKIDPFLSSSGIIDVKQDSIETQQRTLEDDMAEFDYRMEMKYELYLSQFVAAEQYQTQMLATSQMFYA